MKRWITILLFIASLPLSAQVPLDNIKLTNVADGTAVSLTCTDCAGIVVIFSSLKCPFDQYYAGRFQSLWSEYKEKIHFVMINPCLEAEESEDKMKEAYQRYGWGFPYLSDKSQTAVKALDAKRTPEVFLLKKAGNNFTTVYRGAVDDNPQVAKAVTQPYLKNAIEKFLAGQAVETPETRAAGCSIRRE